MRTVRVASWYSSATTSPTARLCLLTNIPQPPVSAPLPPMRPRMLLPALSRIIHSEGPGGRAARTFPGTCGADPLT